MQGRIQDFEDLRVILSFKRKVCAFSAGFWISGTITELEWGWEEGEGRGGEEEGVMWGSSKSNIYPSLIYICKIQGWIWDISMEDPPVILSFKHKLCTFSTRFWSSGTILINKPGMGRGGRRGDGRGRGYVGIQQE